MALNPNKDLKKYYSIQVVAKMYNVSESLLRCWETEFPQLKPRRAGRDIRQYSKDAVKLVGVIHDLVKRRGLKLSAARDVLRKNKEGAYRSNEAIDTLKAIRAQLVELRKNLGGIVADHEYELAES